MKKEKLQQIAVCAGLIVVAAQLHVELFDSGILVSMGAVLFAVYAMIWGKYPVLPVSLLAAVGNFALRVVLHWLDCGVLDMGRYWQEMAFYAVYGALFLLYARRVSWAIDQAWQLLPLVAVDYAANLAELLCRGSELLAARTHASLLLVALLRTVLVWGVWGMVKHQNLLLLKREHADRYRHLMLLIAKLRGEMTWMQKSAAMMEETMNTAYQLYAKLQQEGNASCREALSISKDIHEVKKEYQMILRGLTEALEDDLETAAVSFQELCRMLLDSVRRTARDMDVEVEWEVELQTEFHTDKQYQLLSILRNLLDNALESAVKGQTRIALHVWREGEDILFSVANWGKPIPAASLPRLFEPGYSTKVNFETGQVGRGVGLCLVRDLTEQELGGRIAVEEKDGATCFTLTVPGKNLEVKE